VVRGNRSHVAGRRFLARTAGAEPALEFAIVGARCTASCSLDRLLPGRLGCTAGPCRVAMPAQTAARALWLNPSMEPSDFQTMVKAGRFPPPGPRRGGKRHGHPGSRILAQTPRPAAGTAAADVQLPDRDSGSCPTYNGPVLEPASCVGALTSDCLSLSFSFLRFLFFCFWFFFFLFFLFFSRFGQWRSAAAGCGPTKPATRGRSPRGAGAWPNRARAPTSCPCIVATSRARQARSPELAHATRRQVRGCPARSAGEARGGPFDSLDVHGLGPTEHGRRGSARQGLDKGGDLTRLRGLQKGRRSSGHRVGSSRVPSAGPVFRATLKSGMESRSERSFRKSPHTS